MNSDKITTILGAIGAAAMGAQPVMNTIQPGTSLHQGDYVQLILAAVMAAWGFYTNRPQKA